MILERLFHSNRNEPPEKKNRIEGVHQDIILFQHTKNIPLEQISPPRGYHESLK